MKQASDWCYSRGWFISDNPEPLHPNLTEIGFVRFEWGGYFVDYQKNKISAFWSESKRDVLLIGHAYNPFTGMVDEQQIVKALSETDDFLTILNSLTGIFVLLVKERGKTRVYQDACGMMPVYYGEINGNKVLTNYAQWAADIYHLEKEKWIKDYVAARFYTIGIRQLPGIKSAYKELKHLTPNTFLELDSLEVMRFYPEKLFVIQQGKPFEEIERIMKSSMSCCDRKWPGRCAISLTGGTDSRMTLSAIPQSNSFSYFSFISNPAEEKDAFAAHEICGNLGLEHEIIKIPTDNGEIKNFDNKKGVINHNTSDVLRPTDAEIRKIITLSERLNGKIEIKSHISEIGRAFYYKKLGLKKFPKRLPARAMSNMAKRNMFNRLLLRKMDKAFEEFITVTGFYDIPSCYDQTDMFYWENRVPLWAALAKQRFDVSHETTIIYNNRRLLELFLRFPLEERIADKPQKTIIGHLNPNLVDLRWNLNAMEGWKRIWMEKIFFLLNRF